MQTDVANQPPTAAADITPPVPLRERVDPLQALLFGLILLVTVFLYSFYGNDSNVEMEPRSIFYWISRQWHYEDFRNNWLMLVVAAFVAWRKRHEIAAVPKKPSLIGFGVVLASLVLHVFGYRTQLPRASLISIVGLGWGTCYAIWGWGVARALAFPAAYTLLCFTAAQLANFTMKLRLIASAFAQWLLHGVGIPTLRRGTEIYSSAGGGFKLDVADACSGLRSLVVMTALAAPYAYFTLKGYWRKWTLFALSIPLAMLANTLRIFTLAVVAELIGLKLAMALYHDFSGYLVFLISLGLLMGAGSLLEIDWRNRWHVWKKRVTSRT